MSIFFRTFILLAFYIATTVRSGEVKAQPWRIESDKIGGETNFYRKKEAFDAYWKGKKPKRGQGYKAFQRQAWYWEPRVYPTGELPPPDVDYKEKLRYEAQRGGSPNGKTQPNGGGFTPMAGDVANWQSLGPKLVPYLPDIYPNGIGRISALGFHPTNPSILYVGAPAGGFWRTLNGGQTWETTTDHLPTLGVSDIAVHPTGPNIIYIATGDRDAGDTRGIGVLRSDDGGTTWQVTGLMAQTPQGRVVNRLLLDPNNPNKLIAATNIGIYTTEDAGDNWTYRWAGNAIDMEARPDDFNVLYAANWSGNSSQVICSTDGGATWETITGFTGAGRMNIGVTPANADYVYALATNDASGFHALYRSVDGGANWETRANSPNILGWAADGSDGGGQGWYDLSLAVSPEDPDFVIVAGVNHWRSTDGGQTFNLIAHWYGDAGAFPVHADVHFVTFSPIWPFPVFSGNDGGLYKSTNGGDAWIDMSDGLAVTMFYRIAQGQADPGLVIGGTQDNGTNRVKGGLWDNIAGGDGMDCMINFTDPSRVYASYYSGYLMRSTDGAANFEQMFVTDQEAGGWVTPLAMSTQNPYTIYAGYENVWRSRDAGYNWEKISDFGIENKTMQTVALSPVDSNLIYGATYNSLFRTDSAGLNWVEITAGLPTDYASITSVTAHPDSLKTVFVTFSGYAGGTKVFRSLDGGANWENFSGSLPNVPANCFAFQHEDLDGMYVGTDIGVFYRNKILSDWIPYNDGLPTAVITDFEIHKPSGKLTAATFGRGLWQTDLYAYPGLCAGQITLTAPSGTFTDASGDAPYSPDADCRWLIQPADANMIVLKFPAFFTQSDTDFVYVYDGTTTNAPLLAKLSGSAVADSFIAVSGAMLVRFTSDSVVQAAGWTANYYCKQPTPTCGGELTFNTPTGAFADGSGDQPYVNNLNCNFRIDVAGATAIVIKFNSMDLQGGSDFVYVYEGGVEWGAPAGTYTANWMGDSLVVTGQSALVKFISDFAGTAGGWDLTYYAIFTPIYCGGETVVFTAPSGTFTDGSGADNYANLANCTWRINPPGANAIAVSFSDFAVEGTYDWVRVYSGPDANAPLVGEYSGNQLPEPILINNDTVFVQFASDYLVRWPGFTAHYAVVDPNLFCDNTGYFTAPTDTFSDGSDPDFPYAPNTDCRWQIDVNQPIQLRFLAFDVQENADLVDVHEGFDTNAPILASFTGSTLPDPVVSPSGKILVHFLTDPTVQRQGWVATYDILSGRPEIKDVLHSITVKPNPTAGRVTFDFAPPTQSGVLELTDAQGRRRFSAPVAAAQTTLALDLSALGAGAYAYRLLLADGSTQGVGKLVIVK